MFAYNPIVTDRSGEIAALGTTNAAASLSQGIGQASKGITDSIGQIDQIYKMKQGLGGADAALRTFAKTDENPNGIPGLSSALDEIKATPNPYAQQMSYQMLSQFMPQAMQANNRANFLGYKYDALNQRAGGQGGFKVP